MDQESLRSLQAPLKDKYRQDAAAARITLTASGSLGEGVACDVATAQEMVKAGLHPATGGSGALACSGDMLLQALVACAGVTLQAVASSMGLDVRGGSLRAEGDLDFRGTLGVDRNAPVGFQAIRLYISLDTDASSEEQSKLLELTERYCVVLQTLRSNPSVVAKYENAAE